MAINFSKSIKSLLSTKKGKWLLLLLLALLILLFNLRSEKKSKTYYNKITFKIAHDPSFYPLNLMGKDRNFVAFTSDLLYEIAKTQGIKLQLEKTPSNILFEKLERDEYNAIISVISPSVSYRQKYLISSSFYDVGPVLISKNLKSPITLEEIKQKVIGVRRHSLDAFYFEPLGILLHYYDSMMNAFDDLEKGRIDAIIIPYLLANTYSQVYYPGKYNIITIPLTDEGLRVIATKNEANQFLIEQINMGLKELKTKGVYDALLKKWGLSNPLILDSDIKNLQDPLSSRH